jgi:hypothetical protein
VAERGGDKFVCANPPFPNSKSMAWEFFADDGLICGVSHRFWLAMKTLNLSLATPSMSEMKNVRRGLRNLDYEIWKADA